MIISFFPSFVRAGLVLALGSVFSSRADDAMGDRLSFVNGDTLHGSFLGYDEKEGVLWKHPDAPSAISFAESGIAAVRIQSPEADSDRHPSRVRLTNGDVLPVTITGLDDQTVKLTSQYGSILTVRRSDVDRLSPNPPRSKQIYSGPEEGEPWLLLGSGAGGKRTWQLKNGAFYGASQATLARAFDLPELFSLSFDLNWRNQSGLNLWLSLFAPLADDLTEEDGANGKRRTPRGGRAGTLQTRHSKSYTLFFNSNQIYMQRAYEAGQANWTQLGTTSSSLMRDRDEANVEILVNMARREFTLILDGTMAARWHDPSNFKPGGKSIVFSQYSNANVRLDNLRIVYWNGHAVIEEDLRTDDTDLVRLVNGKDRISGRVMATEEGSLRVSTRYADLKIPMEDVAEIYFAKSGQSALVALDAAHQTLFFHEGGRCTVQVQKIDPAGDMSAIHPLLESVAWKWAAFESVQFQDDTWTTGYSEP